MPTEKSKPTSSGRTGSVVWKTIHPRLSERGITTADWRKAGVEGGKSVWWNRSNGHSVNASELDFLTDDQFRQFILNDGGFKHVED